LRSSVSRFSKKAEALRSQKGGKLRVSGGHHVTSVFAIDSRFSDVLSWRLEPWCKRR